MNSYDKLLAFLAPFVQGTDGYIGFTKADRSQEDAENNKRWAAFHNWYGECAAGDVDLPFEALSEDPRWEYYFTPAVLSEASRLQAKFQHSNVIWIDFDTPVEWETFTPPPSIVVRTSPEKHHCYWLLQDPITNVNEMRYWCKRFLQYFSGGDESGFDATQLLKLPWGLNLKLGARNDDGTAFEPEIVKFDPELKYTEVAFQHIPEPTIELAEAVDLSGVGDVPDTEGGWQHYLAEFEDKIPVPVRNKIKIVQEGGEEKRSGVLYNLTCDLLDLLESAEDTYRVLLGSPNDKFTADQGSRGAQLLWKDINRVYMKISRDKANPSLSSKISDILNGKLSPNDKGNQISDFILGTLRERGRFIQSSLGECFYADTRTEALQLYSVDKETTSPFAGLIRKRFGLNAGTSRAILSGVIHDAINECQLRPMTTFHHFAHYDAFTKTVYVDRYDGYMYVLDGTNIDLKPHGHDNIFFHQTGNNEFPRSFEYTPQYQHGGLDAVILDGPNFTVHGANISRKELRHLLKTWVASFFFPSIMHTKPIVLIYGAADSGKTTLFQNLSVMFTGDSTFSVTEIPKDTKEFNVQVTQSSHIFYDNVEVNRKEMQEKLAQVATGYTVKVRKLFTTNEMISAKSRCFVGITSRTLDRIQEDVAERYIIVPVHPFAANTERKRRAMSNILEEVTSKRNELWSELLDFVNQIIKQIRTHGLKDNNTSLRMADYGAMLDVTCSIVGLSPPKIENFIRTMQTEVVSENDPLFKTLTILMESGKLTPDIRLQSKQLYDLLVRTNRKIPGVYVSPNKLTRRLKECVSKGDLERKGIKLTVVTSGNNNYFSFEQMGNTIVEEPEEW